MNEETQTETAKGQAVTGPDRGNQANAGRRKGSARQEDRGTKKASEIIAEAIQAGGDAGEAIAKASEARARALHEVLSNRSFPAAH